MSDPVQQLYSQTHWASADGVRTVWNFTFSGGYILPAHVGAYYLDAAGERQDIAVTEDMLIGEFQLQIDSPPIPATATRFVIYRNTPKDNVLVDFEGGAIVSETNLDRSTKQAVFCAAEVLDGATVTGATFDNLIAADAVLQGAIAEVAEDVTDVRGDITALQATDATHTSAITALQAADTALAATDTSLQSQITAAVASIPDVSALGYKALKKNSNTGSSTVVSGDNGKAHYKTDHTTVNVPTGLDVEFLTTIVNNSGTNMPLTFTGSVAYLQDGLGVSGTSYNVLPRGTATIWQAASNVWFLSGSVV